MQRLFHAAAVAEQTNERPRHSQVVHPNRNRGIILLTISGHLHTSYTCSQTATGQHSSDKYCTIYGADGCCL